MSFSTGFELEWDLRRRVVMDGRHVATFYVVNGGFFLDLLASACCCRGWLFFCFLFVFHRFGGICFG